MMNDVVTSEIQSKLTPDEIINDFKKGINGIQKII